MDIDVEISSGIVRGRDESGLTVFRGIPFASLPERMGAPHPAQPWRGVREAFHFGPSPPQSTRIASDTPDLSDDWLTVNVWSPGVSGHHPVMVWIQGGGYLIGTSGLPDYDGATLARDGVVLVTFNYRVGLEGFGLIEGTPVNRGLLDQVAALQWVQANISAFGGDPDRVTVFGQSAGAGCAAALLAMPRAAGLFRRVIAQSVAGPFFTQALAADVSEVCAAGLGVRPAQLPTVPLQAVSAAADAVMTRLDHYTDRWGQAAFGDILVAPIVDGDTLPATPWDGLSGNVDLMVGHTRHEQRLLTLMSGRLGQITPDQANEAAEIFAPDPAQYCEHISDPQELYDVVRSDWLFRMPSLWLAQAQVQAGGSAHLYELTWQAPGLGGVLGACHGLDVPLVFGNLTSGQTAMLIGEPTPEAVQLSELMRRAWIAFATDGDPGWPAFDDDATTRIFDTEPATTPYPEQISRRIWQQPPKVLDLITN